MPAEVLEYPSRDEAAQAVAEIAARALRREIAGKGFASLFVSGGSTPEKTFQKLRQEEIDWPRVTVGLVDERWVPPDDPESNEGLVRAHLLRDRAASAGFLPMWVPGSDPLHAAVERSAAYAPHCQRPSFMLLGMGLDGHTASWFPEHPFLRPLTASTQMHIVAAIEAEGVRTSRRLTLTGPPVYNTIRAVLLLFGPEKRAKLDEARAADPLHCPVRYAVDGLGDRLSIVWAP